MNIFTKERNEYTYTINKPQTKNMYIVPTQDKIKIFGTDYSLVICFKTIQNPTLNLKNNFVEIQFPKMYKKYNTNSLIALMIKKMYKKIAEKELDYFMEMARHAFGFAPDNYTVVDLNRPLATVIDKSEILFSSNIVRYDKKTIEYIVFHEFCHLKYKNHTQKFYELLKKYCPNYQYYSKKLGNVSY